LYTVQPNGSDPRRLTNTPDFHEFGPSGFFDVGPCISPDGRFIAFGSDRAGTFLDDLWVVQATGFICAGCCRRRVARRSATGRSVGPDRYPIAAGIGHRYRGGTPHGRGG